MIMRRMTPYNRTAVRRDKIPKAVIYRVRDRDRKLTPRSAHDNARKDVDHVDLSVLFSE